MLERGDRLLLNLANLLVKIIVCEKLLLTLFLKMDVIALRLCLLGKVD